MMIFSRSRFLMPSSSSYKILYLLHSSKTATVESSKKATDQIKYIRLETENENKINDWTSFKNTVLDIPGSLNQKNVDGVLLKIFVKNKKFDMALSLADYLRKEGEMNLGSINGLLQLYYQLSLEKRLSDKEKDSILESYKSLYEQYKVLDSTTGETLLHALCAVNDWKKAMKVFDDIHQSSKPTHSAYSTLIATFFRLNKKTEAVKLIQISVNDQRHLQDQAYKEWIEYIFRKHKDNETILKYLEEICLHISRNCVLVSAITANKLRETYLSLGWSAHFTTIRKENGQCTYCKNTLDCLNISDEEFHLLQQNVKEKLIVGSDLFLKTSPDELKRFLQVVEATAPYDIVLDALNIAFALGKANNHNKVRLLMNVLDHFRQKNKKILLLGRKHMLSWPNIKRITSKTCTFFTADLSQDDPYFITAAILSGPHTDIVSRDLLRGHRFNMQDEHLRFLFQRWQWQHQWMVFSSKIGQPIIQPPLSVTPCAQKNDSVWHLPYEREDATTAGRVKDGTPDWSSWLCLRPPLAR